MHRLADRARACLILLPALLLGGCTSPDDPAEILADYNARLARVLDMPLPPAAATRVPTWPASRDVVRTPADVRIGVFAFLDFGRCGMLREISERNSVLGRVHTPSQRLLYEMRLLRALHQCAALTAADFAGPDSAAREFASRVRQVLETKQRNLPAVYWNATFGAPELREFFAVGVLPLRVRDAATLSEPAAALTWLAPLGRLPADAPLPSAEEMERRYFQLSGNRRGGRTWLSLDLAIRELDRSSRLLEQAAATGRLCPGGKPRREDERLHNVFTAIYLGRVQPWLAVVAREGDVLGIALEKLWQAQSITPPAALQRYRAGVWAPDSDDALLRAHDRAVRRHALAWKAVLAPCGWAPAASVGDLH